MTVQREGRKEDGMITRDEAVAIVGEDAVDRVEGENCEPTSRCPQYGDSDTEWSASVHAKTLSGEDVVLTVYYYTTPAQDQTMADNCADGSYIDWEPYGYRID